MAKRQGLSKRKRFDIFKRDGFTCQYCGRMPPDVRLVVDHIQPLHADGDNDPMNLITSCEECNLGKSDSAPVNLTPRPDADLAWLQTQQEIRELRRYQEAKAERDKLIADTVYALQDTWAEAFNQENVPADHVLAGWLVWASPDDIEQAIRIAAARSYKLKDFPNQLKYAAGVLHHLADGKDGHQNDLGQD